MAKKILTILLLVLAWNVQAETNVNDQAQIIESVEKIKAAIINENIPELLNYVSQEGLLCTDTEYSHKEVSEFLQEKNSHLYLSLFNEQGFSKLCGKFYPVEYPASSLQEFLKTVKEPIEVSKPIENNAVVTFHSSQKNRYPEHWYMYKESGVWKVSGGSFIIGECTCGG